MQRRIEQSLKEFVPAALTFAVVFLLFRVYEFVLLRGRLGSDTNLASLEFGGVWYDLVFSFALIAVALLVHLAILAFSIRWAYLMSTFVFTTVLIVHFCSIQYFATTLVPLNASSLDLQLVKIVAATRPGGIHWSTVTPLLVIIPLAIAGFTAVKEAMLLQHLSIPSILIGVAMFNLSWFLPMSPPPDKYSDNIDYYLATNKTYYLLSDTISKMRHSQTISWKSQSKPKD